MSERVVVGAAIVDTIGGTARVLAACRAGPPALAGWWEFPGGKVEPGESETAALVRECREELGVEVAPVGRLGGDLSAAGGWVLRVWVAQLVGGRPRALEHREIRWLDAQQLYDVRWLPLDLPLVALLGPVFATAR